MPIVETEEDRCPVCGATGGNCPGIAAPDHVLLEDALVVDRPEIETDEIGPARIVYVRTHVWVDRPAPADPRSTITTLLYPAGSYISVDEANANGVPLLDVNGNPVVDPGPTRTRRRTPTPVQREGIVAAPTPKGSRKVETQDVKPPQRSRKKS